MLISHSFIYNGTCVCMCGQSSCRLLVLKTQVVHRHAGSLGRNVVLHMAIRGFAFLCVFIHLTILLEYITVAKEC